MPTPFFSILMPAFNAAPYLAASLSDIQAQQDRDWELVVVDDGSTDNTAEILERFRDPRFRVIRNEKNLGLVEALNVGLAECRGAWIARQDADDRARPLRLSVQRTMITTHPDAVLFHSQARLIGPGGGWSGNHRVPCDDAALRWDLCFRNGVIHTSAVFPRNEVQSIGGYRGDNVVADYDLWSRLLRRGTAVGAEAALVSYRIRPDSIMGCENAQPGRQAGVAEIMLQNLRDWAGATDSEAHAIVGAWIEPAPEKLDGFLRASEALRGRRLNPSPKVVAELDYTLFHRAASRGCGKEFLVLLRQIAPDRHRALPAFRMAISRMLHR